MALDKMEQKIVDYLTRRGMAVAASEICNTVSRHNTSSHNYIHRKIVALVDCGILRSAVGEKNHKYYLNSSRKWLSIKWVA